jgi:hypothetical protein
MHEMKIIYASQASSIYKYMNLGNVDLDRYVVVLRWTPLMNRTGCSIKEETSQHRWPGRIFLTDCCCNCNCNCNGARLSALMTHSAISSYSSNL